MKTNELKIQELRYGNLIQANGVYQGNPLPVSHWLIDGDNSVIFFVHHYMGEFLKDCKPIELTEDWLNKFGFEKTYDDDIWFFEDFSVHYDSHAGYGLHLRLGVFLRGVDTVHELQNIIFAISGTELTLKPEDK